MVTLPICHSTYIRASELTTTIKVMSIVLCVVNLQLVVALTYLEREKASKKAYYYNARKLMKLFASLSE